MTDINPVMMMVIMIENKENNMLQPGDKKFECTCHNCNSNQGHRICERDE